VLSRNFSPWTFDVNFIRLDVKQIKLLCHICNIISNVLFLWCRSNKIGWCSMLILFLRMKMMQSVLISLWRMVFFPAMHEYFSCDAQLLLLLCMNLSLAMHDFFILLCMTSQRCMTFSRCMTLSLAMHDSFSCYEWPLSLDMHDLLFWWCHPWYRTKIMLQRTTYVIFWVSSGWRYRLNWQYNKNDPQSNGIISFHNTT